MGTGTDISEFDRKISSEETGCMKIGIFGYGNLGKGVELAVRENEDAELFGIFTRRDPATVATQTGAPVFSAKDVLAYQNEIDVMILCGGSATDLPDVTPRMAEYFNVVDSFDTHSNIPEHFARVDQSARRGGKLGLISAGWDPGLFSLARLYSAAVLPDGKSYTFWGKGVSQGHSDAIRRVKGVLDARQYTVPVQSALDRVRGGDTPELTTREKHTRDCYVVAEEGADLERIRREIVEMPNYFADYDTTVHFISEEELHTRHAALPHGGTVIRTGHTGLNRENTQMIEYNLQLDSNPQFTAGMLVACARAILRMRERGRIGCISLFDVAPGDLSPLTAEQLRAGVL